MMMGCQPASQPEQSSLGPHAALGCAALPAAHSPLSCPPLRPLHALCTLCTLCTQVQHAERTVREIATLNQMFSAAITQQSEQIEQLYSQAVEATHNIGRANVQLSKAVKTNKSARKYLIAFFLVASLMVLFLDWWNS